MDRRLLRALLSASLVASVLTVAGVGSVESRAAAAQTEIPGDPSVPVTSGTVLPFGTFEDIVVDETHGHVFLSGGNGQAGVVVTDLDGRSVQTLPDLPDASGMLLSADGSTVYVALPDTQEISTVDTATLAVGRTFDTGDACPRRMAESGEDVYFTATCAGPYSRLRRLDPATGDVATVTLAGQADQGFDYGSRGAPLVADAAHPGRLYAVDHAVGDYAVRGYDLDPTGLTATRVASHSMNSYVEDIDFSEDGRQLLVGWYNGLDALDPDDLSLVQDFSAPAAFSVAAGPGHVASTNGSRVTVNNADGSYGRPYFFDRPVNAWYRSVAWASDRLFVVLSDPEAGSWRLFTFTDFGTPAPTFDNSIGRGGYYPQEPHQIYGWLMLQEQPLAGRTLTAWRSGPDGMTSVSGDTDGDGYFKLEDVPPVKGYYDYTLLYTGEDGLAPQRWQFRHRVSGLRTSITLDKAPVFAPDQDIVVSGSLVKLPERTPVSGVPVSLTMTYGGQTADVDPVTTDGEGRFSFEVPPGGLGEHVFKASFVGDGTYDGTTGLVSVWVKQDVSLEVASAASFLLSGRPQTFHGTITAADGSPVGGENLTWERYTGDPGRVTKTGTVTTDDQGSFSFSDQTTTRGMARWVVSYRGDASRNPGSSQLSLPVYSSYPSLAIRTDRSRYPYGAQATVSADVGDDARGTIELYAKPYGEDRILLHEGGTMTGQDAAATVRASRNTSLTLAFEPAPGNYMYAPHQVTGLLAVHPMLDQRLRGSYALRKGVYLVRTWRDPRLTVAVAPGLPGRCVRVRVERYRDGAYRFKRLTGCIRLDSNSSAAWKLTARRSAGARFRLRYESPGDASYSRTKAPWTRIRFTR
jgi:hypothetical protein